MRVVVYAVETVTELEPSLWRIEARSVAPTKLRQEGWIGVPGFSGLRGFVPEYKNIQFETRDFVLRSSQYLAQDDDGRWFVAQATEDGRLNVLAPNYSVSFDLSLTSS